MIEAWFNERGFKIHTLKGESKFIYDLPNEVTENAAALYAARWMVLNHMMQNLSELGEEIKGQDLVLYTDSRLVEELRGDLTPDTPYAKSSLRYFIQFDYVKYRRVTFEKSAASTINGKLSEPVIADRPTSA